MPVYLIGEITVMDRAWVPDYAARVHDILARHGGRYLSRSGRIETLAGISEGRDFIAIVAFPSRDAAMAFLNDPDYAPLSCAMRAGADCRFRLIDDSDYLGAVPYLPKG